MAIEKLSTGLTKVTSAEKLRILKNIKTSEPIFKQLKSVKSMLSRKISSQGVSALTDDFVLKKQRLIQELSKVCDKNVLARIEKAQTPEQLAKILAEQDAGGIVKMSKGLISSKVLDKSGKLVKPMTLAQEQAIYQQKCARAEFILAREKALHVPSRNPRVIAIENILKEQYGVKFASLKDNEVLAKQVLKAYETAAKNGVEVPKNVIVSDFMFANGENLFNGTILLNSSQRALRQGFTSTTSEFHVPLHEIMHGEQPKLISFNMKKIPSRFQEVKQNLSGYSAKAGTHETFTELNTKRLIDGLNPQEQELYNYLNLFG